MGYVLVDTYNDLFKRLLLNTLCHTIVLVLTVSILLGGYLRWAPALIIFLIPIFVVVILLSIYCYLYVRYLPFIFFPGTYRILSD